MPKTTHTADDPTMPAKTGRTAAAVPKSLRNRPATAADTADATIDADPSENRPSEAWELAHCGIVLTARDIFRALEGGPEACGRPQCRSSGICGNEQRGKLCAKKLSPAAETMVELMMVLRRGSIHATSPISISARRGWPTSIAPRRRSSTMRPARNSGRCRGEDGFVLGTIYFFPPANPCHRFDPSVERK